jgi:hypothetical protein
MKRFQLGVAAVVVFASLRAAAGESRPDWTKLIDLWKRRDGAAFIEVGDQVSHALITDPKGFCSAFAAEPLEFTSWLSDLGVHTFTDFRASTAGEREASERSHAKLRQQMERAATSLKAEPECIDISTRLLEVLKKTQGRIID